MERERARGRGLSVWQTAGLYACVNPVPSRVAEGRGVVVGMDCVWGSKVVGGRGIRLGLPVWQHPPSVKVD